MQRIASLLAAFGRFWWEFLIGENPGAFIATVVTVGVALLLRHDRDAAIFVVPAIAIASLVYTTLRARVRSAAP